MAEDNKNDFVNNLRVGESNANPLDLTFETSSDDESVQERKVKSEPRSREKRIKEGSMPWFSSEDDSEPSKKRIKAEPVTSWELMRKKNLYKSWPTAGGVMSPDAKTALKELGQTVTKAMGLVNELEIFARRAKTSGECVD